METLGNSAETVSFTQLNTTEGKIKKGKARQKDMRNSVSRCNDSNFLAR